MNWRRELPSNRFLPQQNTGGEAPAITNGETREGSTKNQNLVFDPAPICCTL